MKHQILIASYAKDFPWLRHCLRSLEKYATGFLPPVVAVDWVDLPGVADVIREAHSSAIPFRWDGPGFGRAQHAMMSGDIICPDANFIWLLGSDCLATRDFSPDYYCHQGKPIMLYNTWEHLRRHHPAAMTWKAGVEKAIGGNSHGEFMRRLPLAYPSGMLGAMRDDIARRHGMPFRDYVLQQVNFVKNFSESNIMGEWAWRHCRDAYDWVNIDNGREKPLCFPADPIVQHWSHGGFDRPRDMDGRTPRAVIIEALGSL